MVLKIRLLKTASFALEGVTQGPTKQVSVNGVYEYEYVFGYSAYMLR